MKKIALALAFTAAFTASATAATKDGDDMMGVGLSPCVEFTNIKNHVNQMIYYSWAQGFITAANWSRLMQGGDSVNVGALSQEEQIRRMKEYCKAHPLAEYVLSVTDLINSMPTNPGSADAHADAK